MSGEVLAVFAARGDFPGSKRLYLNRCERHQVLERTKGFIRVKRGREAPFLLILLVDRESICQAANLDNEVSPGRYTRGRWIACEKGMRDKR